MSYFALEKNNNTTLANQNKTLNKDMLLVFFSFSSILEQNELKQILYRARAENMLHLFII